MLATRADIREFERMAKSTSEGMRFRKGLYLLQNYHFFLSSGFDEIKVESDKPRSYAELLEIQKDILEDLLNPSADFNYSCGNNIFYQALRLRFRQSNTGCWYRFLNVASGLFYTEGPKRGQQSQNRYFFREEGTENSKGLIEIDFEDVLQNCRREALSPRASALLLPNLLYPRHETLISPGNSEIKNLLCQIQAENDPFSKITWRDLEEIVAELLKSRGMEVTVTKRTRDDGRDIIARGELIPGEPMLLAVEVKHKKVVGINDLRAALYANRNYPSLLVATSGRFSAGIIKEGNTDNNAFRLLLKDGVGLRQWIQSWLRAM